MSDSPRITMDQLRIGLYVYLDLTWFQHPFAFSHFKISDNTILHWANSVNIQWSFTNHLFSFLTNS